MVQPWIEPSDLNNPSDPYAYIAIDSATYILWALSGRKFNGVAEITEQYVCPEFDIPSGCSWETSRRFLSPQGYYGYLVDRATGGLPTRIRLRQQPVRKIVRVEISGNVIPSADYQMRNNSSIVLNASSCSNPIITYKYGAPPPQIGRMAAIELANEFLKAYNNDTSCELPKRVTSVQRQGLSIQAYDPAEFLDRGRIGLQLSDYFVSTVNPGRAHKPAKVFSPDMPRGYTTR
jgi:hypothetical protein